MDRVVESRHRHSSAGAAGTLMTHLLSSLRTAALAAACLCAAGGAAALDYPPRKPGLWEMSIGEAGGKTPPQVMQQCIDAATDQLLRDMGQGMNKDMCSKNELRADGPRLVVDSVCKIGTSTATTHSVMTGDFGSAYRMEMKSRYNPPLGGRAEADTLIESKWVGPCKPGQKPGDVVTGNGMKMNVLDMMKGRK
jgi:hypothetical protein